jgi:8-oxo-dGTP pyrophosphatase MutT (NUDIX family)
MERISSRTVFQGPIADLRIDEFRYPDGSTAERQVVSHPGAVVVVAHDERFVYLVRQPREAVGEKALLELPAGKLDVEGEAPIDCARRELGEETGKRAAQWQELRRFYTSPGLLEEEIVLYLATDLAPTDDERGDEERIEVVPWPLDDLDSAIAASRDAKSLVGLLLLRERRGAGNV